MHQPQPRVALLIDADNVPADKVDDILTELSTLGEISIRRIYGNWTKPQLNNWQSKLLDYALHPVQQFDYSKGKNATDMAMTVDAMELLYTERPGAFAIVSSDADFTPLVMHLRGKGATVYGFGMAQTPKAFVNACSRFLYLEAFAEEAAASIPELTKASALELPEQKALPKGVSLAQGASTAIPTQKLRQDTRLMNMLRSAVQALQDEEGWALVSALRTQIGNKASFDPRNYGYATLSKLLLAVDDFEFRKEGTGQAAIRRKTASSVSQASPVSNVAEPVLMKWPTTAPRKAGKALPAPLYALRSVLLQVAVQRTTVLDILYAVPELTLGSPCAYSSVASRLRERGVLHTTQSPLRLFEQYPDRFGVDLPDSVRFITRQ